MVKNPLSNSDTEKRLNALPIHGKLNFSIKTYMSLHKKPKHIVKKFFSSRYSKDNALPRHFIQPGEYMFPTARTEPPLSSEIKIIIFVVDSTRYWSYNLPHISVFFITYYSVTSEGWISEKKL